MLSVSSNIASLNARRAMYSSSGSLDKLFKRLSSGLRINSAADDAAGLQISNRLTSEINGNNTAIRNANDAISVTNVADGAMDESVNIMQRMRTLAIQARDGANTADDRIALNQEFQQMRQEMDRIANSTTFAGQKLLDGTFDKQFQVGAYAGQTIGISDMNVQTENLGNMVWSARAPGFEGLQAYDAANLKLSSQPITLNGVTFDKDYNTSDEFIADINNAVYPGNNAQVVASTQRFDMDSSVDLSQLPAYINVMGVAVDLSTDIDLSGWDPIKSTQKNQDLMIDVEVRINQALANNGIDVTTTNGFWIGVRATKSPSLNSIYIKSLAGHGFSFSDGNPATSGSSTTSVKQLFPDFSPTSYMGAINLQSYSNMYSNIDMSGNTLNQIGFYEEDKQKNTVDTLDVLTFDNAATAISTLDTALRQVGTQRSGIGAKANALDSITRNLSNGSENMSAARSRIKDADFAKETAEMTRLQILQQASSSVLSQANARPQSALQLLGN